MTYKPLVNAGISIYAFVFSTTLFAAGFCDNAQTQDQPLGGFCTQVRETFKDSDGSVLPDYSDLDLLTMLGGRASTLEFEINVGEVFVPPPPTTDVPERGTTVFELQLEKSANLSLNRNVHQALILTVSRAASTQWILKFDWLSVAANWSITTHPAPQSDDSWQVLVPAGLLSKVFKVRLVPSLNWQSLEASVSALDRDAGGEIWSEPNRKVFAIPATTQNVKPWRIRSGVLSGNFSVERLRAQMIYRSPRIDPPYR